MRKKVGILLILLILACLCVAFCSCDAKINLPTILLACRDATAKDFDINMEVDSDTYAMDLSKKVIARFGTKWKVYSDETCLNELDKIVTVNEGRNVYYLTAANITGQVIAVYRLIIFRPYKITVTYYVDEEIFKTDYTTINREYTVNTSLDPQKLGYEFDCWTDVNGQKRTSFIPTDHSELYAKFKPLKFNATLNPDGGTIESTNRQVDYGNTFTLPIPTKRNYDFAGWYIADTKITDENGISIGQWKYLKDCTLTAKWTVHLYQVTAVANNSEYGSVVGSGKYVCGETITVTAITKIGYTFRGWYENDVLLSTNLQYSFVMPSKDVVYSAKWEFVQYACVSEYENLLGDKASTENKYAEGQSVTLSAISKTDNIFLGWYKNGEKYSDNYSITFTMPANDVSFTQKWARLTWDATQMNDNIFMPDMCRPNEVITLSAESFKITAQSNEYTFKGWFLNGIQLGTNEILSYTVPAENAHLNAQWETYSYIIVTKTDDNSVYRCESRACSAGKTVDFVENSSDTETFLGWYDSDDKYVSSSRTLSFTMPSNNVTYVCKIANRVLTVSLNNNEAGYVMLYAKPNITESSEIPFKYGEQIFLSAVTNCDDNGSYIWQGWYKDGDLVSTNKGYSFHMPNNDVSVEARWLTQKVNVRYADAAPTIYFTDNYSVDGTFTVRISGNYGSSKAWYGWQEENGTVITNELEYKFDVPDGDVNLVAKLSDVPITITFYEHPSASILPGYCLVSSTIVIGKPCEFTAVSYQAYSFEGWYENDVLICSDATYRIESLEETPRTLKMHFVPFEGLEFFEYSSGINDCKIENVKDEYLDITELIIPECVTEIKYLSFSHCNKLESITIPVGIKITVPSDFSYIETLKELRYAGTVEQWKELTKFIEWTDEGSWQVTKIICSDGEVELTKG